MNWYQQRDEDDNGEIYYEAHDGSQNFEPLQGFARFEGANAKTLCDKFIAAMNTRTPDAGPQDVREAFERFAVDVKGWNIERWEDGRYKYHHDAWLSWQAAFAETQRLKRQVEVLRGAVNLVRKQDPLRGSALMAAMDEALAAADKIAKE